VIDLDRMRHLNRERGTDRVRTEDLESKARPSIAEFLEVPVGFSMSF
jgi:hypothetical protein